MKIKQTPVFFYLTSHKKFYFFNVTFFRIEFYHLKIQLINQRTQEQKNQPNSFIQIAQL